MIEYLDWDSNFFGCKIGKINYKSKLDTPWNFKNLDEFDLVYVFSDNEVNLDIPLMDVKVTFCKTTKKKKAPLDVIDFNKNQHSYDELLELVYMSGHESRFLKDRFFGEKAFKKLYKVWIDKILNDDSAKILVNTYNDELMGFVAYKYSKNFSNIDFIAVSLFARGKGLGKKLLDAVESNLGESELLTVPTQEQNVGACQFYINNDFQIKDKIYIYHYATNSLQ